MDLLSIQIQNIMHNHNIVKKALCHHRYPYTQTRKSESHNEQLMLQFSRIVNEKYQQCGYGCQFHSKANGNEPCVTLQQD